MQLSSTQLAEVFVKISDPRSYASAVNVEFYMIVPCTLQTVDWTAEKSLHTPKLDKGGKVNVLIPLVI